MRIVLIVSFSPRSVPLLKHNPHTWSRSFMSLTHTPSKNTIHFYHTQHKSSRTDRLLPILLNCNIEKKEIGHYYVTETAFTKKLTTFFWLFKKYRSGAYYTSTDSLNLIYKNLHTTLHTTFSTPSKNKIKPLLETNQKT